MKNCSRACFAFSKQDFNKNKKENASSLWNFYSISKNDLNRMQRQKQKLDKRV